MYKHKSNQIINNINSTNLQIFGKFHRPIGKQQNGNESVHETAIKRLKTSKPPKEEYGGPIYYQTFEEIKDDFTNGKLHPADLKLGLSDF